MIRAAAARADLARATSERRKVIYISWMSLSRKVVHDWFIDDLVAAGLSVEYWDVTEMLAERRRRPSEAAPYLRTFTRLDEVAELLRQDEYRDAIYVMLVTFCGQSADLYRMLSGAGVRTAFLDWGRAPIYETNRWRRFREKPRVVLSNLRHRIKASAYQRLGLVRPFDIVFAGGEEALASRREARVIPVNLIDYDNYAAVPATERRDKSYAVFLDMNLPFQFDIRLDGLDPIDPRVYFESLNRFFDMVERKHGVEIVVAAHPNAICGDGAQADYNPATFNGRRIVQGHTAELVHGAAFVLSHQSTSYSYAIIGEKPIYFIYTEEMQRLYSSTRVSDIRAIAEYLDAPVFNIDDVKSHDAVPEFSVNRQRYASYRYAFLTTRQTEHRRTRDIFVDTLVAEAGGPT